MSHHFWNGQSWQAVQAETHRPAADGDCLVPWLGGLAGHRFISEEKKAVTDAIGQEGRFLTDRGVATEAMASLRTMPLPPVADCAIQLTHRPL